jgi:hypothetical protein
MEPTSVVHSPGFAHQGVSWSPFYENRLAVASAANYGLVGNGRLQVVTLGGNPAFPTGANVDRMYVVILLSSSTTLIPDKSALRPRMRSLAFPGLKFTRISW